MNRAEKCVLCTDTNGSRNFMFGGRTSDDIGKNVGHEIKKTVKSVQRLVAGK